VMAELKSRELLQVHRSRLVHVTHIKEISPSARGCMLLTMSDGSHVRTNRTCKAELMTALRKNSAAVLGVD
jgi:DNA-binding LytR/AlgR family response regulator